MSEGQQTSSAQKTTSHDLQEMRKTHGGGEAELPQEAKMGLQELRQRRDAEGQAGLGDRPPETLPWKEYGLARRSRLFPQGTCEFRMPSVCFLLLGIANQ